MKNVFISGSITIKKLDSQVIERLKNIISSNLRVIVGDASGVDSSIQAYLKSNEFRSVVVYCAGDKPRHNLGHWDTKTISTSYKPGTRQFFTVKDKAMAADCDYGFMIWDANSTGTLSNAIELVEKNKIALVYIYNSNSKQFLKIKSVNDLEKLMTFMSEEAVKKADEKMGLFERIALLKRSQHDLFDIQSIETVVNIKQPSLTSSGASLSLAVELCIGGL